MDEPGPQNPEEVTLPEPGEIVEVLDGIPDAYARAQLGLEQAEAGETIPLGDL